MSDDGPGSPYGEVLREYGCEVEDPHVNAEEFSDDNAEEKGEEGRIIAIADTVVDPVAMVIKSTHASVAGAAVF